MELDYKIIGNRIKAFRKAKKWTQEYLAELSGVDPSYISHIERAATKASLATIVSIVNCLGVTLDEVVYTNLVKSSHVSNKLIDELLEDCTADELNAIAEVVKTVKKVLRNKK